ncbi:hypothetical protein [Desulfurobacterium atlanticum]|uniref:Uncharacterized protein n=1 Tax=Desulfurobacterium atlanticum TaxID=240169 RepID=A0A238XVX0_9BACT|nr:hypothetical protein [Desulfurobacterium atlanticum]SNR62129.1 hypothetical protein SAMN06265340_101256 [Desulfurobacterium atlanticum]
MNTGMITILVAALFCGIGVVAGFLIGRMAGGSPKEDKEMPSIDVHSIEAAISDLKNLTESLIKEIESSTKEVVSSQREKISKIISIVESLKEQLKSSELPLKSSSYIDDILFSLKSIDMNSLPSLEIDENLVVKLKDKVDIIRTEIESLKLSINEKKDKEIKEKPEVSMDFGKIEEAIRFAREINEEAVKGDLISLMYAFKDYDKTDLLKTIDNIALNSKQLVFILEDFLNKAKEREIR